MPDKANIPSKDRDLFDLVVQAAFANPFSEERQDLDDQIVRHARGQGKDVPLEQVVQVVRELVDKLETAGKADIRMYEGEERTLLQTVLLFEAFHRYMEAFDELIQDQVAAGDTPCRVTFAKEALALLCARGYSSPVACSYFAMFYQMRRAYHFIHTGLVGTTPCMRQLRLALWNNVFTHDTRLYERYLWNRMEDFSTLLLGDTGTGKGAAAAAIGQSGFIPFDESKQCFARSFTRTFVSINLSQFPESLIESELFGHRKGAFTGAIEHHEGVFARCLPHGAIFLDEIGDVAIPVQIKLLQVLQERTFTPVGSHDKLRFSGRVIAATNKPLALLRKEGRFRDDFYYRLCSDVITLPTLHQRIREDTGELGRMIRHILNRLVGTLSDDLPGFVESRIREAVGRAYPWPGNVRELEQAVRRILLTDTYAADQVAVAPDLLARTQAGIDEGTLDAKGLLSNYCKLLYERFGTYEEVARRTELDRRTAKKYVEA